MLIFDFKKLLIFDLEKGEEKKSLIFDFENFFIVDLEKEEEKSLIVDLEKN